MVKESGKMLLEWYNGHGHKEGSCKRDSYTVCKKIAKLWESKDPGNSVVISHILYNTHDNTNKWEYKSNDK